MNSCRIGLFKTFFLLLLLAGPVFSQAGAPAARQVVVVDFDEVFRTTLYGRRIIAEFQQANQALSNEFERIAEELVAEEKNLSDLRGSIEPSAFKEMALAFDQKSTKLRQEQEDKRVELKLAGDSAQSGVLQQFGPIFVQIMQERNATILLEKKQVVLVIASADITKEAIRRIDQELGDGQ
jgi:Skp family chaperone for outer membrane proteins